LLADAVMTQPGDLSESLVEALRRHYSDEQLAEIVLKVLKFNVQKVMVALGTHSWMTAADLDQRAWNRDGTYVVAG
jgi:hypothetical protein